MSSMVRNDKHVVRNPQGGWSVEKTHAGEIASKYRDPNAEAVDRMRGICRNQGAECVVHSSDGAIRNLKSCKKEFLKNISDQTLGPIVTPYLKEIGSV
jgi:hypothetical protein